MAALLLAVGLGAQNRNNYFKAMPAPTEALPTWAQLMYAADPQVFEVDWAYRQHYAANPFVKNLHTQNYRYWRRKIAPYLNAEGFIRPPAREEEEAHYRLLAQQRQASSARLDPPFWQSMGPMETYEEGGVRPISWQVNVYCIDQSASNPDVLFAGTEGGGVFKTTDRGLHWALATPGLPVSSVGAVQIHPTNPNHVLVAANRRIYRTTDGGDQWSEAFFFDGDGYEIKYHPENPDTVYLACDRGLYRSTNGGQNWTQVFSQVCWDIDFQPGNPAVVYLLRNNANLKKSEFFRSTDHGYTWALQTLGWYSPENTAEAIDGGGKIAVTAAMPDRVYVALIGNSKADDDGWIGVWRSENSGQNWINPSGQIGGPYNDPNTAPWNVAAYSDGYHQGYYNFDFEASPTNPNKIWIGTIRLSESSNGGQSFQAIGAANSTRLERIHADIQAIEVNGNEIWVASDGGINYSTNELMGHESRKFGVIGSDFWGFGSGWNEDVLVGGKYHNGNGAWYQTYGAGKYLHVGGVEEPTGYVNPLDNRTVYFNRWWVGDLQSQRIPNTLDGAVINLPSLGLIPNESYIESSSSGLYFDHRYADHLYMGQENKFWKSTDAGSSFTALYTFGAGTIMEIAQSRHNPDVFYCVFQPGGGYWDPCRIYRSTDGGNNWTVLTDVPGNRWRLNITLNPENQDEIWASCNSGSNGAKVYRSTNGGQTWQNVTTSALDGQRPKDLMYQDGTDGVVYLATNNAIFYWDPTASNWVNYSDGLPFNVEALQLRPFYRDGKLRLATYGRGFWEAPLVAQSRVLAQPLTGSEKVYCARDTVAFDCYSVVNHQGAEWAWTFEPAPLYVSDIHARNPKVVFGEEGSYSVGLTVTDGAGQSSTQLIPNMVQVQSYCDPETFPGQALETTEDGDYAQLPDIGLETNVFSLTAWVKPNGIQPEYSAIFMNDGPAAGLNFREQNNTLAYHWPGGAWWWDSNLEVPADEWSHVALVVKPTSVTVYVNGRSATHQTNLNPVLLEAAKLGNYQGWGGRTYNGQIDEVTLWRRALTTAEIRELRHLTHDQVAPTDADLLAYYQFNEPEGRVNDKKGALHARLSGNATRVTSSAPVGGGQSKRLSIQAAGDYDFEGTGFKMGFDAAANSPQGEVVVTRIQLPPYSAAPGPLAPDSVYWVFNNYGTNELPVPARLELEPHSTPASATQATLHQRINENGFEPDWLTWCMASSLNQTYLSFPDACELEGSGQFFLTFSEPMTDVEEEVSAPQSALIYPNPSLRGQNLQVDLPMGQKARVRIFNADGKVCGDYFLQDGGLQQINLTELPAGSYFYSIQADTWIKNGVLVLSR